MIAGSYFVTKSFKIVSLLPFLPNAQHFLFCFFLKRCIFPTKKRGSFVCVFVCSFQKIHIPTETGSNTKLSNTLKPVRFQILPNILDSAPLVILVAFSSFLPSPGSGQYAYGDDEDWYSRRYKGDCMLSLTLLMHACIQTVHAF